MKISSLVVGATVAFVCVLAEARAEAQGELSGGVYTITVAADARLVAKKKLTVVGKKIGFAEGATVNIDDLDTLVASDKHVFTLMSSDVGIVGPVARPFVCWNDLACLLLRRRQVSQVE